MKSLSFTVDADLINDITRQAWWVLVTLKYPFLTHIGEYK